jgi:hypothetical protein
MLPEFAQSLYQSFEREGIPLLLAGGWAVCHHGYTRYTNDVDWICSRADESRALNLMSSLGFEILSEAMATRFRHPRHFDLLPVDLIWVDAGTFAKMAATDQRTGIRAEMPVIDFESLLAMKLHALKDDKERHGKDMLDIRLLLAENENAMTEERLQEFCRRYAGPDAYNLVRMIP